VVVDVGPVVDDNVVEVLDEDVVVALVEAGRVELLDEEVLVVVLQGITDVVAGERQTTSPGWMVSQLMVGL
jgi:hypothetical protein